MLLAARQSMLTGGGPTAKSYVQDGLVAMWDGIENAGWGTHDANATTWVDSSGNGYDMPLANVSINADNMGFDGTGSAYITSQEVCDAVMCIEAVFNITEEYAGMIVQMGYATSTRSSCLLAYSPVGAGSGFRGTSTAGYVGPKYIFNADKSKVIGQKISVSGNSNLTDSAPDLGLRTLCINGTPVTRTTTQAGVTASTTGMVSIGSSSRNNVVPSTFLLHGNIYCIRLYSRDLTSDEIAANYAIDAARFGL